MRTPHFAHTAAHATDGVYKLPICWLVPNAAHLSVIETPKRYSTILTCHYGILHNQKTCLRPDGTAISDIFPLERIKVNSLPANWSEEKAKKGVKKELQELPWGVRLKTNSSWHLHQIKHSQTIGPGASSNYCPKALVSSTFRWVVSSCCPEARGSISPFRSGQRPSKEENVWSRTSRIIIANIPT